MAMAMATMRARATREPYETVVLRWKFDLTPGNLDIYFSVLKGVCEDKKSQRGADRGWATEGGEAEEGGGGRGEGGGGKGRERVRARWAVWAEISG
jgi:uncharacterized membrane protein YgcG